MALQGREPGLIVLGCLAERQEKRQHGASTNNLSKPACQEITCKKPPRAIPA
jgi:hypothetical protein